MDPGLLLESIAGIRCVSIHRFVLAVSVPCSPPFPRGSCPFPECSRNVPPRYIGVRDPVYRCLGPGLSFDADPSRGVPGVFPECSPPLDQWCSGQEVFGPRVFRGPFRPFMGRSRSVWGPSGHEVFGSQPIVLVVSALLAPGALPPGGRPPSVPGR